MRELLNGTLQNLFYPPLKHQYTYFEHAREFPFTSESTLVKAAWAADASMLAYARYGATRMEDDELSANFMRAGLTCKKIGGDIANWNVPGTQAVLAEGEGFAILAFRGTEADDPKDLRSDANLALMHEPDYRPVPKDPHPALGHLAFITHLFAPPCFVHWGFQLALNQVWDDVHRLVTKFRDDNPGSEICFTGHSLGGALAVLAFSRFADPDISLFTFGCPRVGNDAFRQRILENPGRGVFRYVNYDDAVAHVPVESLLYAHAPAGCYRFTADGRIETDDGSFKGDVHSLREAVMGLPASITLGDLDAILAPPSVVDHSPARYCFRLWDCVRESAPGVSPASV